MTTNHSQAQSGFALLLSIIVVGVVLSIGLSILELSIKQVQLSSNARESEVAFHAANAGMECARYWRRERSAEMETGQDIDPQCFGESVGTISGTEISDGNPTGMNMSGDGEVFQYEYEFTWGDRRRGCTVINTVIASTSPLGTGLTLSDMNLIIAGYPEDPVNGYEKVCEPGSRCTTISVQGYNRPCSSRTGFGSVQREVLLQF